MSLPFNIAIDGFSSCGKSTIAKSIAYKYKMRYVDTGAMYRAVTLYCMKKNIIVDKIVDFDFLLNSLNSISINFKYNSDTKNSQTFLNGVNVENEIRGIDVSNNVSIISQVKQVREKLIAWQQEIGRHKNVVMDGRDIGTKVFPEAKIKLFITARLEIRAKRRHYELIKNGNNISFDEVKKNINDRDIYDVNRTVNPLKQAKDAILFDNSDLSINDQNILIEDLINNIR